MSCDPALLKTFHALRQHWSAFLDNWQKGLRLGVGPIESLQELFQNVFGAGKCPLDGTQADIFLSRFNRALYATLPNDNLNHSWGAWLNQEPSLEKRNIQAPFGLVIVGNLGLKREAHPLKCDPIPLPPLPQEPGSHLIKAFHTLQQKIFLLADYWEHHNVVLAIEQNSLIKKHGTNAEKSAQLNGVLEKRDWLISWVFSSLIKVDKWLHRTQGLAASHNDFQREWEASSALSLACQQKLLLPATVSRHVFSSSVLDRVLEWCQIRNQMQHNDLAFLLIESILSAVFVKDIQKLSEVLTVINSTDFLQESYNESFDSVIALKSVCWLWDSTTHGVLAACYALNTTPRLRGGQSSQSEFLISLYDLVQMPKSFPSYVLPPTAGAFFWPKELAPLAQILLDKAIQNEIFEGHKYGEDLKFYFKTIRSRFDLLKQELPPLEYP